MFKITRAVFSITLLVTTCCVGLAIHSFHRGASHILPVVQANPSAVLSADGGAPPPWPPRFDGKSTQLIADGGAPPPWPPRIGADQDVLIADGGAPPPWPPRVDAGLNLLAA